MPLSEFDMISRYFRHLPPVRKDTVLAIGDDAALLDVGSSQPLLTTILLWQEGRDYFNSEPVKDCAQRMVQKAINDLESLGGKAAWMTLSLSFTSLDEQWLSQFSAGLGTLLQQHHIQLVGGDTTRGPETLRCHLMGVRTAATP